MPKNGGASQGQDKSDIFSRMLNIHYQSHQKALAPWKRKMLFYICYSNPQKSAKMTAWWIIPPNWFEIKFRMTRVEIMAEIFPV